MSWKDFVGRSSAVSGSVCFLVLAATFAILLFPIMRPICRHYTQHAAGVTWSWRGVLMNYFAGSIASTELERTLAILISKPSEWRQHMSVMKVIELMANSDEGWEDAAAKAVAKASESVKGIKSVWVQDFSATVGNDGKIDNYRVTCKVTFEVKD